MWFLQYPLLIFVMSFLLLWLAAWGGERGGRRGAKLDAETRTDFTVIQGATLTLLGLIIGFTFSMAVGRYDQRKLYEATEANTIGTEYARAGVLPIADSARVRDLLRRYVELRIAYYVTRDQRELRKIDADTTETQHRLWEAVSDPAKAQPSAVSALVLSGMNEVLDSQGYAEAAWRNRIPEAAWILMFLIAIFANAVVGYGSGHLRARLLVIVPLVISISFFLIADIDSPRQGMILVHPQNLESLRNLR